MTFLRRAPFIRRRSVSAAGLVNITDHLISDSQSGPGTATVSLAFLSSGALRGYRENLGGNIFYSGEWLVSGPASNYSVQITNLSGDVGMLSGPASDTWLNLATSREWFLGTSGENILTVTFDAQIRLDSTLQVLDTASITLDVTSTIGA